jgi:transposase
MVTKRVTLRLYPNKAQDKKMQYWRRLHKDLYNACITHRQEQYKRCKVARVRHNWHHQVSVEIVSSNSLIGTEQLNIKGMTKKAKKGSKRKKQKTGLNPSILEVGIGELNSMIKYKVIEAGGMYIEKLYQLRKHEATWGKEASLFDKLNEVAWRSSLNY